MYSPAPPQVLLGLASGANGIRDTLKIMCALSNEGKKNGAIISKANELLMYVPPKAWFQQVQALFQFVKDNIRYTRDVQGVETVYYPEQTLAQRYGDCDDKSVLLAALLLATGHPTRFTAVGFQPGQFSHVYPETLIGRNWIALDATENQPIGWQPPGIVERMTLYC